jgi:hypothetical protein
MTVGVTARPRRPRRRDPATTMPHGASALHHAVRIIHAVCGLAGSARLTDEVRIELRADNVRAAIRRRDTGPVFDWLMAALSYQGISDQVAYDCSGSSKRSALIARS